MNKRLAKILQVLGIERNGFSLTAEKAVGGRFHCVDVCDVKITPNSNSGTILFILLYPELATEKPEHVSPLADELRQCSDLHILSTMQWKVRAIHEDRLAPRVRVDI